MSLTFDDFQISIDDETMNNPSPVANILFPDDYEDSIANSNDADSDDDLQEPTPSTCAWDNVSFDSEDSQSKIKVFLRIRPVSDASEKYITNQNTLCVDNESYMFSSILGECNQKHVFETCAFPLLKDFIDGNNSLLFTYGITSSGKSYTMKGTTTQPGIIPYSLVTFFEALSQINFERIPEYKPDQFSNSVHLESANEKDKENAIRNFIIEKSIERNKLEVSIFEKKEKSLVEENKSFITELESMFSKSIRNCKKFNIGIWVSYYEIYNETIRDLLELQIAGERKQKLVIQKDQAGNYFINGLRKVFVTSAKEAFLVYLFGQETLKSHISQTALNQNSSRSHSAFQISMVRVDHEAQYAVTSNISLCDLAGAERSKKTQNTGIRLKEAAAINTSLMCLNRCVKNLQSKQRGLMVHTSYRDSKITQVFQPYLSGDGGKTFIISNLNPSVNLFEESKSALSFCTTATSLQQKKVAKYIRRLSRHYKEDSLSSTDVEHNLEYSKNSFYDEISDFNSLCKSNADFEKLKEKVKFLIETLKEANNKKILEMKQEFIKEMSRRKEHYIVTIARKELEIEEFKQIYNEKIEITNNYYKGVIDELKDKIAKLEDNLFEAESDKFCNKQTIDEKINLIKDHEENLTAVKQKLEIVMNELDLEKSKVSQFKDEFDKVEAKLKEQTKEDERLKSELLNYKNEKDFYIEQNQKLEMKCKELTVLLEQNTDKSAFNDELDCLKKQLHEKELFIQNLQAQHEEIKNDSKRRLQELKDELKRKDIEMKALEYVQKPLGEVDEQTKLPKGGKRPSKGEIQRKRKREEKPKTDSDGDGAAIIGRSSKDSIGSPARDSVDQRENILPEELLKTIGKRKKQDDKLSEASQMADVRVFSTRKEGILDEQQFSKRKRLENRKSSNVMISPESLAKMELNPNDAQYPYNTRSRKRLF